MPSIGVTAAPLADAQVAADVGRGLGVLGEGAAHYPGVTDTVILYIVTACRRGHLDKCGC